MEEIDGKSNGAAADVNGPLRKSNGGRRSSPANWTEEEDDNLRNAVQKYEGKCWKKIAECLPGRTDVQCLHRWTKVLRPGLIKGPWNKQEDILLIELVGKFGDGERKWSKIAEQLPGRMGKQCRERWYNHLNPVINKAVWTEEEENILINAHVQYGNKWSMIAKLLPGRTDNSVKNHWNCNLKRRRVQDAPVITTRVHSESNEQPESWGPSSSNFSRESGEICHVDRDRVIPSYYYNGLCYEPVVDANNLATGSMSESCIGLSKRYAHTSSMTYIKESTADLYRGFINVLRRAAMTFENMPAILKRRKRTLDEDVSSNTRPDQKDS